MAPRRRTFRWIGLAMVSAGTALAETSGADFAITRQVIASGGSSAGGGAFATVTTSGQASVDVASGGAFILRGGFHVPADLNDPLFSNGFEGATP